MSRILFIGDPHLRINDFEQGFAFLRWVEEVTLLHKPEIVCNLGDTFHNHAVLRSELMTEFRNHVNTIVGYGSKYWYILGNHDQYKPKDNKYHALQAFEGLKGLTIFDKITELPQHNITVVPYVQKYEDFPLSATGIVISHNTFIGADYGFKREDCGIDADKSNADIIVSGHIHKRQQFGKVIYPGTPYAHNATDVDQTKGLLLFDITSFEQTFIESPFPKWKSLEFEICPELNIAGLHATLLKTLNNTDKWILKVSGPKAELSAYFKSKQYFKLINGKNIIAKTTPTDAEKQNRVQIKSSSPTDIINEYVNKVYSGGADKSRIIHKAQTIIKHIQ